MSVDSEIPQGSVLVACLFLYYMNDLQAKLHSSVGLFADDTSVYLVIKSHEDARFLQQELITLAEWEEQWRMNIMTDYNLHNHILANGVTVTEDLKWDTHIHNICVKPDYRLP